MQDDQNRALEVGESSSVLDFFRQKLRSATGSGHLKIINSQNPDVASFIEENSTSQWAKKDQAMHMNYQYQKPQDNF